MHVKQLALPSQLLSLLCAASLVAACSNDTSGADDEAGETTNNSGTDEDTDEGESSTDSSSGTDSGTSSSTDDEGNFISDESDSTTETVPGPLGTMCETDENCEEGLFCNGAPELGFAVCSECAGDEDCDGGNCTLSGAGYFVCGDGSAGQMCETDAGCGEGLYCAEVLDLGGLFNGNFCSECSEDAHCTDGQLCSPMADFETMTGQKTCVDPGTVPDGQICDYAGNGDEACEGYCAVADIMGLIMVGVCGECESDADCMMGTCQPPVLDFGGVMGSFCG